MGIILLKTDENFLSYFSKIIALIGAKTYTDKNLEHLYSIQAYMKLHYVCNTLQSL